MAEGVEPKSPALETFERLLAAGKDSALLRFSLGNEYLKGGNPGVAVEHLARAVAHDADYTAAWKLLGKALVAAGRHDDAIAAYSDGIEAAKRKGDRQAEKEMSIFLRRLEKAGD
jgi:predicted Zn-dependent protease